MRGALALDGVTCVRGERVLFEGLSLALAAGEATVVTGPNGAGKSSLLRIAAGLLAPTAGMVRRDGAVALMTEAAVLDAELPLARALAFWGGDVAAALERVGLAEAADVPVRWLSTGQRKRAALARVIAADAAVWLLDEPANGLDDVSVAMLEGVIAAHRASGGIALIATHLSLGVPDAQRIAL